ncbi:MAG: hypothetical protein DME24_01790 [Verrucomicrobia bacterium]|nr:MAG: hypothetical protein DME24_01790 [Verrucomicrobiota bacterium]
MPRALFVVHDQALLVSLVNTKACAFYKNDLLSQEQKLLGGSSGTNQPAASAVGCPTKIKADFRPAAAG